MVCAYFIAYASSHPGRRRPEPMCITTNKHTHTKNLPKKTGCPRPDPLFVSPFKSKHWSHTYKATLRIVCGNTVVVVVVVWAIRPAQPFHTCRHSRRRANRRFWPVFAKRIDDCIFMRRVLCVCVRLRLFQYQHVLVFLCVCVCSVTHTHRHTQCIHTQCLGVCECVCRIQ